MGSAVGHHPVGYEDNGTAKWITSLFYLCQTSRKHELEEYDPNKNKNGIKMTRNYA